MDVMTQPAPFHPSDEDIHRMLEHDPATKAKYAHHLHPRFNMKSRVLWRSSQYDLKLQPPKSDLTGAKDAIRPHFDQ